MRTSSSLLGRCGAERALVAEAAAARICKRLEAGSVPARRVRRAGERSRRARLVERDGAERMGREAAPSTRWARRTRGRGLRVAGGEDA